MEKILPQCKHCFLVKNINFTWEVGNWLERKGGIGMFFVGGGGPKLYIPSSEPLPADAYHLGQYLMTRSISPAVSDTGSPNDGPQFLDEFSFSLQLIRLRSKISNLAF